MVVFFVMDVEKLDNISGLTHKFLTHATEPFGLNTSRRSYPQCWRPLEFSHIHQQHVGTTFLLTMPPTKEHGNQAGWPQTWVNPGCGPRNASTDQPYKAADCPVRTVIRTCLVLENRAVRQRGTCTRQTRQHRLPGSLPKPHTAQGTAQMRNLWA